MKTCKCCGAVIADIVSIKDLTEIPGLEYVKRAVEVSLSGNHPLLIISKSDQVYVRLITEWMAKQGGTVRVIRSCPCGHYQHETIPCTCSVAKITKYWKSKMVQTAVSASQMSVEVSDVDIEKINAFLAGKYGRDMHTVMISELARTMRERKQKIVKINYIDLDKETQGLMTQAAKYFKMDGAGIEKAMDIGQTIALMSGSRVVPSVVDIAEALQYNATNRYQV